MTDPTTPEIAFDGKCAFAVSVGAAASAPDHKARWTVVRDGRTYGFLGPIPKFLFLALPGSIGRADRVWAKAQAA